MNTAGRRQKQAAGGFKNIRPQQRPKFSKISAEKARNRLIRQIEGEKMRAQRKKK